ncbi:OLC1v1012298C1 [Oldenlandia corymbosa var. corymbosa]|uniref:OLC1v1012298C1 n=1 Tax=Oldenlandia corymbosa var. corymbosa TaxID=529605 RepID=A0AAV1DXF3_OLDCO|nr:OLC1v1012298C1 [Oldenlandia corymbosa var. corymbosa]
MAHISPGVDAVVKELGRLDIQSGFSEVLLHELRFLIRFLFWLWDCKKARIKPYLRNATDALEAVLREAGVIAERKDLGDVKDWDSVAPALLNKLEQFEPEIRKIGSLSLDSLRSTSCSSDEILELVNDLVWNFKDFAKLKPDIHDSAKERIWVVVRKLRVLRSLVHFSAKGFNNHQLMENFLICAKDLMHNAAFLSLFFLLKGKDGTMAQEWETVFSDQLEKCMPRTPEVAEMFVGFLKASRPRRSDKIPVGQDIVSLVDLLLLKGSDVDPLTDRTEILKEGLIFAISFLKDPEEEAVTNAGDGFRRGIDVALTKVLSLLFSLYMDGLEVDISSLQEKIDRVKAEIRKHNMPLLNSPNFRFPSTNATGFISFLLKNMEQMVKHNHEKLAFAGHRVMIVHEELISLQPFLETILELQKERGDVEALWTQIINTILLAEYVISSCLVTDYPIWCDMLWLSDVMEAIKLIRIEVNKYSDQVINNTKISRRVTSFIHLSVSKANPSNFDDVVIGRETELKAIIERLNRGTRQLDIVSIVGMAGLGKTTVARKVYNDPCLKYYFSVRAWCCISQVYNLRELYFDILSDVTGGDARQSYSGSTDNDLAETLRKRLKQQKYLIVLDDIWSVEAWNSLKDSFPDDNKGSRIMFTSRIHDLVSQAKPNCSPHPLRSLSDEESWELLQGKLSLSPLNNDLAEIGKNIAKNCKGLPLAVALVAEGLIPRDDDQTNLYEVAEQYLSDLISRNLVILAEKSSIGGIKACRVHDLLHDLCSAKIQEENFLQCVRDSDVSHSSSEAKTYENYRLSVHAKLTEFIDTKPVGTFVHSLVFCGKENTRDELSYTVFKSFKLLNVLDLELFESHGDFPREVTFMVHLRYLAIACKAEKLPESIVNMWNLETLILPGMDIFLPEFFWRMKNLRQVYIKRLYINGIADHEFGQLKNLEVLSVPYLGSRDEVKELLRRLPGLRKLRFNLENTHSCKFHELSSLTHLESVTVFPNFHVSRKMVKYEFRSFDFPSSLRKLTLNGLEVEWSLISSIGKLPNLEVLKLNSNSFIGNRWDVEDGQFLNLKQLELNWLKIRKWTFQDEPFPSLERLIMTFCFELRGIPASLGYIPTLEKIEMICCSPASSISACKIFREQQEMGNEVLQLVINKEYHEIDDDDDDVDDDGDEEEEDDDDEDKDVLFSGPRRALWKWD